MGYPKWLVYDGKKTLKWMRTGGTRISGNHHYDQAQTPNKNCLGYHWKMAVDAFLGGLTTQAPNMVGWCWISTQSCGPDCYSNDSIQVYQRETDSLNIRNRTGLEHNFFEHNPSATFNLWSYFSMSMKVNNWVSPCFVDSKSHILLVSLIICHSLPWKMTRESRWFSYSCIM